VGWERREEACAAAAMVGKDGGAAAAARDYDAGIRGGEKSGVDG
jgi:hypothetical protein